MNNEIAKRLKNAGLPIVSTTTQSVNSTTTKIPNFKTIFSTFRNPVLVWHCQQSGELSLFVVFCSEPLLSVKVIYGSSTISVAFDGNDVIINNVGNWGYGIAIGFAAA